MKKYNLIIFDLDGTLANTSKGILHYHKFTNTTMGRKTPTKKELDGIIGGPLLKTYIERFKFSEDDAKKAVEIYRLEYAKTGIDLLNSDALEKNDQLLDDMETEILKFYEEVIEK